jgi:hypothetical protein
MTVHAVMFSVPRGMGAKSPHTLGEIVSVGLVDSDRPTLPSCLLLSGLDGTNEEAWKGI